MAEGKRLYTLHCSNCHMEDGTGLAALYPPLKHSDYMLDNFQEVVCGMRHGQQGPIVVNGLEYNQPMPGNPRLTDLELAEITTYIYNEFADSLLIISMHDVRKLMESCGGDEKIGAVPD
jgi:mono/diheme cytochrome c family protein